MPKGTCPNCKKTYYGWALQEEKHQYCDACGAKLIITRLDIATEEEAYAAN